MTQRDNILQELNELQSSLVKATPLAPYHLPAGYFENLAEKVLDRIRALEAGDAAEELAFLSPLLSSIPRQNIYTVPANFFNELQETIPGLTKENTPAEEIQSISPLLGGLKKEMPYSVPSGYFETITPAIQPRAKLVPITRQKWFRYAVAATIVGIIATAGLLIFNRSTSTDPNNQSLAWVEKNLKKVSTDDINTFVEMTDAQSSSSIVKTDMKESDEVKEMVKDISDKDIQNFLDETQSGEQENNDDILN